MRDEILDLLTSTSGTNRVSCSSLLLIFVSCFLVILYRVGVMEGIVSCYAYSFRHNLPFRDYPRIHVMSTIGRKRTTLQLRSILASSPFSGNSRAQEIGSSSSPPFPCGGNEPMLSVVLLLLLLMLLLLYLDWMRRMRKMESKSPEVSAKVEWIPSLPPFFFAFRKIGSDAKKRGLEHKLSAFPSPPPPPPFPPTSLRGQMKLRQDPTSSLSPPKSPNQLPFLSSSSPTS